MKVYLHMIELHSSLTKSSIHTNACRGLMSCSTQAAIFQQCFHTQKPSLLDQERQGSTTKNIDRQSKKIKKWLFFPLCSLNDCFLQETEGGELLIISRIHLQDRVRGGCHGNWQRQQWTKWSPFCRSETMKELVLLSPLSPPPPSPLLSCHLCCINKA